MDSEFILRAAILVALGIPMIGCIVMFKKIQSRKVLLVTGSLYVPVEQVNGGSSPCAALVQDIEIIDISDMNPNLYFMDM